jgi:flavin reductase (DIM6/NTAB) family NADH-FMN oxidoreductase RutF
MPAAPLLADALGWLECRRWADYDVSTHTLYVGEVVRVEHGPGAGALVYRDGIFHGL